MANSIMTKSSTLNSGDPRPLDQYLATLNPHRVGFPCTPLPLPFHTEPVFRSNDPLFNEQVDDHRSQITEILDNNTNFSWRDIIPSLQWRSLDGSDKRRTLTISVIEKLEWSQSLEMAETIYDLLRSSLDLDVQIETSNSKGYDFQEITNQPPSDEDKHSYNIIEPYLLHTLDQQLPSSWLDFGLFLCKDRALREKTKKSPLIVIFVQEYSMANWNTVAAEITRALKGKFEWRFQPGCHITLSPLRTADGFREDGEFSSQVESGSTMTNAVSPGSQGTVGVFVDLEVPDEWASIYAMSPGTHKAAITCHHCIAPVDGSPSNPGPIFTSGFSVSNGHDKVRSVSYPGERDRSASTAYLDSTIKELTKKIKQQKNLRDQALSYDEKNEITQAITILESEKLRMKDILARCLVLFKSGSIGKVLVSSGVHVSDLHSCNLMTRALQPPSDGIVSDTFDDDCSRHHRHHLHDFAVISLNKDIRAVNVAPPQDLVPGLARTIYRTGSPKIDSVVYKQGGASGATQGRVKDYKLVNRSVDFPNSSLINGKSVNTTQIRFHAWRIISQNQSSSFSVPGDSASGINDEEVQLVGQLHSGFYDGRSVPVTYMNGINDVFRDVEDKMPGIHISLSVPESSILKWIAGRVGEFLGRWSREPKPKNGID